MVFGAGHPILEAGFILEGADVEILITTEVFILIHFFPRTLPHRGVHLKHLEGVFDLTRSSPHDLGQFSFHLAQEFDFSRATQRVGNELVDVLLHRFHLATKAGADQVPDSPIPTLTKQLDPAAQHTL